MIYQDFLDKDLKVSLKELENELGLYFKKDFIFKSEKFIMKAVSKISLDNDMDDLDYRFLAGRLKILQMQMNVYCPEEFVSKTIFNDIVHQYNHFYDYIKKGVELNVYDEKILDLYTEEEFNKAASMINRDNDFIFDYKSAALLESRYLAKHKGQLFELPQMAFMMCALWLASNEKDKMLYVENIYNALSNLKISLATPILMNLRIKDGNLSSCFINSIDDDMDSIFHGIHQVAKISKQAGGIGINLSRIRANGSWVKGEKGASNGVVPWIKIINDTLIAVDQQGKRKGAGTVALDIWHLDIEDFLHLQTESGDLRLKAFDVFPQVVIPDLFMRKVIKNEKWNLYCPYEVKQKTGVDIAELYGNKFDIFYESLSLRNDIELTKSVNARELMIELTKTSLKTGKPYVFFKDTVNEVNPNKHDGFIGNSNLCVTPDSLLLTDKGYRRIDELAGNEHMVWNGEEFSLSKVFKTNDDSEIMKVLFSDGSEIKCTPYHKFVIHGYNDRIDAKDLEVDMQTIDFKMPNTGDKIYCNTVISIEKSENSETYCFTEPKRNMGIINGVITGNCVESFSNFSPTNFKETDSSPNTSVYEYNSGLTHTCNLISINLTKINSEHELKEISELSVRCLDNTIDLTITPIPESLWHNILYRIIGVGTMGLHDYLVKNKKTYKDLEFINDTYEIIAFSGLKQSALLAAERGVYPKFKGSDFEKGIFFGRKSYEIINETKYVNEWLEVFDLVCEYGLRNGSIFAIAPNTSSSNAMMSTPSYLPTYKKVFLESNSRGSMMNVAPLLSKETFWFYKENINTNQKDIIDVTSTIQKWVDQGISMELIMNPNLIENAEDFFNLYMYAWLKKCKTVYYIRSTKKDKEEGCISCAG